MGKKRRRIKLVRSMVRMKFKLLILRLNRIPVGNLKGKMMTIHLLLILLIGVTFTMPSTKTIHFTASKNKWPKKYSPSKTTSNTKKTS